MVSEWKMVSDVNLTTNNWIKEQSVLPGNGIIIVYRTHTKNQLKCRSYAQQTKAFINYDFVHTRLEIFILIMKMAY